MHILLEARRLYLKIKKLILNFFSRVNPRSLATVKIAEWSERFKQVLLFFLL